MELQQVEKQHMDALKALSDTNLKVSEAKVLLLSLQKEETTYLQAREERVMEKIEALLADSADILKKAEQNYVEVHDITRSATEFSDLLASAYADFKHVRELFEQKEHSWNNSVKSREDTIKELRQVLSVDRQLLVNDQESLERARKALEIDRQKLKDGEEELKRSIKRLKEGRI